MQSVSQIEKHLTDIMGDRARLLARETGCIQWERKFDGADLLQTLVFGWLAHPDGSLEQLASTAATRDVLVSDTAIHKRFTESCAHFLHAVWQELTGVVVQADQDVPMPLLRRFSLVIIEDSSSIALPDELAEQWQGCGGHCGQGQAAINIHVRWEIKRGQIWGPNLTDVCSAMPLADRSAYQLKLWNWRAGFSCWPMHPALHLSLEEAIVLLRERWHIELLYKLWKQDGQIDEWRTAHNWRILCELYAKLIGVLLQHWFIVLLAWQDEQRSLVKLAQVIRDGCLSLMEALAGYQSLHAAIMAIARRMRSDCCMNTRKKHPNSAQLFRSGLTAWLLSP